jgi:hypothetical protein
MSRIYISYRRTDAAAYAGRLFDHLTSHFGQGFVFMDVQGGIARGQDFVQAIDAALNTCDVALVIIGNHWVTSTGPDGNLRLHDPTDWVRVETAAALRRNVLVIPVLIDGARLPDPANLPEELRPLCRRNVCELTDSRWSYDVGELVKDIEKILRSPKKFKILSLRNNTLHSVVGVVIALIVVLGVGLFVSNAVRMKQPIPESMITTAQPAQGPAKVSRPPGVSAGPGGVAAGRDISGSKIQIGPLPPPSPETPRR